MRKTKSDFTLDLETSLLMRNFQTRFQVAKILSYWPNLQVIVLFKKPHTDRLFLDNFQLVFAAECWESLTHHIHKQQFN